jgi:hypothetical protein
VLAFRGHFFNRGRLTGDELLELDGAPDVVPDAWLERRVLRAEPVALVLRVVDPVVV